jgi:hypothetical protein
MEENNTVGLNDGVWVNNEDTASLSGRIVDPLANEIAQSFPMKHI